MNKKLLALALAALPMAAFADSSNVVIYGTFDVSFENLKAESASVAATNLPSRNRLASNSSNLGFKGTEDLGNGLKAIFQVESSINVDSGTGTLAGRNTNVGLAGNFGTAFYGNWDSPYKSPFLFLDPFGAKGISYYGAIMGNRARGFASAATAGLDERLDNGIQYWTPSFNGLSARFAYAPKAGAASQEARAAGVAAKPKTWAASVSYENGPLVAAAAYAKQDDQAGGAAAVDGSEDKNWRIGVGYTLGATKLSAGYERQKSDDVNATNKRNAWVIGASHQIGNTVLRARYNKISDRELNGNDVQNTGAKNWAIGVGQALSKRTEVYALYTKLDNEAAASYDFGLNPITGVAAGSDPKGFALGVRHSF